MDDTEGRTSLASSASRVCDDAAVVEIQALVALLMKFAVQTDGLQRAPAGLAADARTQKMLGRVRRHVRGIFDAIEEWLTE